MNLQEELFTQSLSVTPGGVHSPVRAFKNLHRTPLFFKRGKGAYLTDIEQKNYIDFCMSFGPLILGHQDPTVLKTLIESLQRGWSFGACEPYSLELAQFLVNKISFIDQIRFVNSGTEAVMTALRIARGFTNRDKIIKFNGCYHGHVDSMLIKAGSGLAGESVSSSKGIPQSVAKNTLVFELGDLEGLNDCFQKYGEQIACIIIEPLAANNGLLVQDSNFLNSLRILTRKYGALLIFDEVISGFRVGFEGMAGKLGIEPDLLTYGKIIGGGMPVGAVAGKEKIMNSLAPLGSVYQAGTLSANPLAMVAGLETVKQLNKQFYRELNLYSENIVHIFKDWLMNYQSGLFSHLKITHTDSLFWISSVQNPQKLSDIPQNISTDFKILFEVLLNRGIYLAPNAYEVGFISISHNRDIAIELEQRLWN